MWACVSPASAGTSRTTGATPSTSSTGGWVGGAWAGLVRMCFSEGLWNTLTVVECPYGSHRMLNQ